MRFYILPFIFLCPILLNAQNITQNIRGRITDALNNKPLQEASVQVSNYNIKSTVSTEGVYLLENVPVGRHILEISHVGYQNIILKDVYVISGKETVLDISLEPSQADLEAVTVTAPKLNRTIMPMLNILEKDRFQYAATFADPGRYATYAPGVAVDNDQANNISIRGVGPNALQWYLEGAEIVNPNHLSNAGTLSDKASANGGGVMIVSSNLLDNTTLYQGVAPPQYGNALAGVLNMNLRKGNNNRRQHTVSAGVIGFDLATEGYFSKNSEASYIVNYRYSFTGLLSQLGIKLGDEDISFQDLSLHMHFPTQWAGQFSVFAIGGLSDNIFKRKEKDLQKESKDNQDISFDGQMGVVGLKHNIFLKNNMKWQTLLTVSALDNSRIATNYGMNTVPTQVTTYDNTHSKLFFKSALSQYFLNNNHEWAVGLIAKREDINSFDIIKTGSQTLKTGGKGSGNWWQPFGELNGKLGEKGQYQVGIRYIYFDFNSKSSIEPSASYKYNITKTKSLQISYALQSQLISPDLYFVQNEKGTYINSNLDFVKAHNASLKYESIFPNDIRFCLEGFYQRYFNVLSQTAISNLYYNATVLENLDTKQPLSAKGDIFQSVGGSVLVSQSFSKGYFWMVNATAFDASVQQQGITRDALFNSRYIANAFVGKEWMMGRRQNKFLGASIRGVLRGGFYATYFANPTSSRERVADYMRGDLNIYFKRNTAKWNSTLQLDIQNFTNRENDWDKLFDTFSNKIILKKQLGMIPNLSYKVEF